MMDATLLQNALRDLAEIDANGQLSELIQQHARECRALGLPRDDQLLQGSADYAATVVGRAAAQMFGLNEAETIALGRDVFRLHPRRDAALDLIDFYMDRTAAEETQQAASAKLARERRRIG